jgi:Tfp pilus assembly protein PilX
LAQIAAVTKGSGAATVLIVALVVLLVVAMVGIVAGGTGTRYFATDARGIIFQSTSPIANPIAESTAVPVQ